MTLTLGFNATYFIKYISLASFKSLNKMAFSPYRHWLVNEFAPKKTSTLHISNPTNFWMIVFYCLLKARTRRGVSERCFRRNDLSFRQCQSVSPFCRR